MAKTKEEREVLLTEAQRNREEAALFAARRVGEEITNKLRELTFITADREDALIRNSDINNRVFDLRGTVDEQSVRSCLGILAMWRRASNDPITLVLDSPGGVVKDGLRLYDYIRFIAARNAKGQLLGPDDKYNPRKHKGIYFTTMAMGDTSSIAVAILQAGNRRVAAPSASLMIHELSAGAKGSLSEIKDLVGAYEKDWISVVDILAERAKVERAKILELTTRKASFMTAREAEAIGLVDAIGYQ